MTNAGNLPFDNIIHMFGPKPKKNQGSGILKNCIINMLDLC